MSRGVLCAVDVNDFDQSTVDLAGMLASKLHVVLDLIHVTWLPDPTTHPVASYLGQPEMLLKDRDRLEKITPTIPGVAVDRHQLSGVPGKTILEFVARNPPMMLILGSHRRTGLARLLGSTATYLLRHANCPVLIAPQHRDSNLAGTPPDSG